MRVYGCSSARMPSIARTKRKVLEAAEGRGEQSDSMEMPLLAAKLERASSCTIGELAKWRRPGPMATVADAAKNARREASGGSRDARRRGRLRKQLAFR
jgi:hypothetical protein